MIIDSDSYIPLEDGEFSFLVDADKYKQIREHLSSKGIQAGGHYDVPDSEIRVGVDLPTLNKALADFSD